LISEIRARHYKSFGESTIIPLRPITIFIGKNNSGKTAAARLPLLLQAAFASDSRPGRSPIPLSSGSIDFGGSLRELFHKGVTHGHLELGASIKRHYGGHESVDFAIQLLQTLAIRETGILSKWDSSKLERPITWDRKKSSGTSLKYDDDAAKFSGVWPTLSDRRNTIVTALRENFQTAFRPLIHLGSLRRPVQTVYETKEWDLRRDHDGSTAPYLLNDDPDLLHEVSVWYEKYLDGPSLTMGIDADVFRILLGSHGTNLARAGQGLQQVLPVVTLLKGMKSGAVPWGTAAVFEEPELHLHPSVHGDLTDLAIDAVNGNRGNQVIIETHSENLILRLRRRIAEGVFDSSMANIIWFDSRNGQSTAQEIEIRPDGSVDFWPAGIFSEDLQEVLAIQRGKN